MPEISVRPLHDTSPRVDSGEVAALLAAALTEDPGWTHVVPDRESRRAVLRSVMRAATTAGASNVRVACVDGHIAGAAIWPPPGGYPWGARAKLRVTPPLLGMALRHPRDVRSVIAFGAAVDAAFPREPVRYLLVLGVAPGHQRRGIGTALLADGLAAADSLHESVYLETSAADNVAYYRQRGFVVLAGSPGPLLTGGPDMWRMQRPAPASGQR